jgi:hypothetical protein
MLLGLGAGMGFMFKDIETAPDLQDRIELAQRGFERIADIEEEAFQLLIENKS